MNDFCKECCSEEELNQDADQWEHRSSRMKCRTCMWFIRKGEREVGRCRRHSPTTSGYPVVFEEDWCGDHKIDETK